MEIALSPTSIGVGASDLADLTVEAESLGYSAAWLAEVAGPEAFTLAGTIAARTNQMALGVAVVPAATRSPSLLAMGAATVSDLLGGRSFSLGIGASSEVIVRSWHDREFHPPLARVKDSVLATRALLRGERGYRGDTVSIDRFALTQKATGPVGIYVGALGPRMLRLAGAVGDGVCLNLMTAAAVPRQLDQIRRGAEDASRELPTGFGVMARFHLVVTDDVASGRSMIRAGFGPYFAQPVYNRFLAWMGYVDEARTIATAFERGDRDGVAGAFHDEIVDAIALIGAPGHIRERLEQYAAAGIDVAALSFHAPDPAAVAAAIRLMAPGPGSLSEPRQHLGSEHPDGRLLVE